MSVGEADLIIYLSGTGASDGGSISATALASGVKNGLWPNISDVSRLAGGTRYKKWFLANENGTDDLVAPAIYCAGNPAGIVESIGFGADSADDADSGQGNMTAWAANAQVALVSSGADGRQCRIYGLDAGGLPATELVTLNGVTEVLSAGTYSKVYAVIPDSLSGSVTVTVKQGTGGTTRGTIGVNKKSCWLWVTAVSRGTAIILPNLPAASHYGFWDRQVWAAGIAAARPTSERIAVEETA